ncbi:hypothetical protein AVEN_213431-1 [Araneus ventricosus]|uniref:Uncharacterized protein n=1 Tax=Araneus ventricosus TaxID=182803 RepID=A0A4Y2SIB2_ARAVE|nr:hypothetical protein AVEN_213431-1 [Araneus ventricosus]
MLLLKQTELIFIIATPQEILDQLMRNVQIFAQNQTLFSNMFIKPYSNTEGIFSNPFLGDGLMDAIKNPFLEKNEKLMLTSTGQSWIPLLSSNPFFDDCVADTSTYILNPSEDPMKNVPQSPMDYKTHCQEWVEKHREYHFKNLRSFSI